MRAILLMIIMINKLIILVIHAGLKIIYYPNYPIPPLIIIIALIIFFLTFHSH